MRQAGGPQRNVGVGDGEPVPVVGELEHNWVVDQPTFVVEYRGVSAAPVDERPKVAHREQLGQPASIGAMDFDLPFAADVPQLHPVAAEICMAISSLTVLYNSLRLRKFNPEPVTIGTPKPPKIEAWVERTVAGVVQVVSNVVKSE